MWPAPIAQLLVLLAMAPTPETTTSAVAQGLPEPIATQQTLFEIPFRIDPAVEPDRSPVEVQLYVSGNRGATWDYYSRVDPARGRFRFRAGVDGEFWFVVRTLDRSGRLRPQEHRAPELRVIVDTLPPKMQLQAQQGQAGQVTARWQIDEPHPKTESLKIEYRTAADAPWQQVAVDHRQQHPAEGSPQTGEVTWWPQAGPGPIQIRAELSDTAGNLAVSHAQVSPAQVSPAQHTDAPPTQTASGPPSAWRASTPEPNTTTWPAEQPAARFAADTSGNPAPGHQPQPADHPSAAAPADRGSGLAGSGHPAARYPQQPYAQPDPTTTYPDTGATAPLSDVYGNAHGQPTGSLASTVNPPFQNQYTMPGQTPPTQQQDILPAGVTPRMVNSLAFQVDYDVTSAGPAGISTVELWVTQDGGRTWRLLATDDDNRSPLLAQVYQEGTYGLKVVVGSAGGLGGQPPLTGELPEIVVGVDLTMPTAQITAAQQGSGPDAGKLMISWQADDSRLAARPITLLAGDTPAGPWTTIASGLENTGRYAWPIDYRSPPQVYLRLEVRDEAGNLATNDTSQPVSLAQPNPATPAHNPAPPQNPGRPWPNQPYRPWGNR